MKLEETDLKDKLYSEFHILSELSGFLNHLNLLEHKEHYILSRVFRMADF